MLNFKVCFHDIRRNLETLTVDELREIETALDDLDHTAIQGFSLKFASSKTRGETSKKNSPALDIIAARLAQCIAIYCQEE